jgi:hypothetical protein
LVLPSMELFYPRHHRTRRPPVTLQALLVGYKGQQRVERGFRFLNGPRFLACSLYLKQPERIRVLLMVMTVCFRGVICLGASHPKGAQGP